MQKSAGVTAPRRCELFIGHIVALLGGCCSNSFVEGFYLLLHHLQKVKFQIVGLRNLRQNGMIRRLLPCLDLPQCHTGIQRCFLQHFAEHLVRHKVRAGTGRQIPAAGQQPHRLPIDLLIAVIGVFGGRAALGKGRRVQNNIVIVALFLFGHLGQQVKNIGAFIIQIGQPVFPAVFRCQFQCKSSRYSIWGGWASKSCCQTDR